jgi:hypothetical protein
VTMDMQKSTLYFIKGCKMWEMMFDKSNGWEPSTSLVIWAHGGELARPG